MSGGDTQINIPLGRLAWMLTVTVMPTTLAGFAGEFGLTMGVFIVCVVLSLSIASLAIGDWMVQTNRAQNNSAALWVVFLGLPAQTVFEIVCYSNSSYPGLAFASASFVTGGTLLLAWLGLEGVSLLLLAVNALNAAGTAWALSGSLKMGAAFAVGSLVLGIGVSMLRGFFKARTAARR